MVNFFREEGIIEVIEKEVSRFDNYFKGILKMDFLDLN